MKMVLGFAVGFVVVLFAYGSWEGSPLTNLYTGIALGLLVMFALLQRWARWSVGTLWIASLVGLGNMLGGVLLFDGQPLYMTEVIGPLVYDKVFHALAAFGMTFLAWEAAYRWAGEDAHRGGMLLLTWLAVMGGGAVVEIAELIGSQMSGVSVGDYLNNAFDLLANAAGATAGVVVAALRSSTSADAAGPGRGKSPGLRNSDLK